MALANEMRRLTEDFLAAHGDRSTAVADIRDNTAKDLSKFHTSRKNMASQQSRRLADYVNGLSDNISKTLKSLDKAHQQMAAEQRNHLADYVDGLHDNVADMLQSIDIAHHRMSVAQRRRLDAERTRLASEVEEMRRSLQADQSEARKIWNNFAATVQGSKTKKTSAKTHTAKAAKPVLHIADDLTVISGIGMSRQNHLNDMGIYTFAQLAKSASKKIKESLGAPGRIANVEEWIEEARKRSSFHGKRK